MRHIITGGAGFTGVHLASALLKGGDTVVIFDSASPSKQSPQIEYVQGDVRSADDLVRLGLRYGDVVYHLAARQFHSSVPARNQDDWFADVNVTGTSNLLKAMEKGGAVRLVFFSTDMTYGKPMRTPIPPDHPQSPIGPYGRSKVRAEKLIQRAAQEFGLRATIFRPRLIAGAGRLGILKKLFWLIKQNLPIPLIGSGENRYQMVAVDDCVAAALSAVRLECPSGPFNLGSLEPPTVRTLLSRVIARAGSTSMVLPIPASVAHASLSFLNRLGTPLLHPEQYSIANLDVTLDIAATQSVLGWNPTRADDDIVFEAYEHFVCSANNPQS